MLWWIENIGVFIVPMGTILVIGMSFKETKLAPTREYNPAQ